MYRLESPVHRTPRGRTIRELLCGLVYYLYIEPCVACVTIRRIYTAGINIYYICILDLVVPPLCIITSLSPTGCCIVKSAPRYLLPPLTMHSDWKSNTKIWCSHFLWNIFINISDPSKWCAFSVKKRSTYISMFLYIFKRFGTWKDLKGNTMLKRISLENFAMWFQDQDLFWRVNYNNERIINNNNTRQTGLHHYYGLILLISAHLKRTTVVYLLFHSSSVFGFVFCV